MKAITEQQIEQVAKAADIVDIIGAQFSLEPAGTSWRALCPFHREKSPSFHVSPQKQAYYCFGCGAGGGVFKFVMEYERVDFATAVHRVALRVAHKYQRLSESIGLRHKASGLLSDYASTDSPDLRREIDWELHLLKHEADGRDAGLAAEIERAHWGADLRATREEAAK